jgi:hypothetical protein
MKNCEPEGKYAHHAFDRRISFYLPTLQILFRRLVLPLCYRGAKNLPYRLIWD